MNIVRYHHLLFLAAWAIGLSKWETNAFVARSLGSRSALSDLNRSGSYAKPIPSQQQNYNSLSNIDTSIFASSPSKYNNEVLRPRKRADRYIATQLAAALVMLMSLTSCLPLAWAASDDPMVFNGDYNDPLHPMCKRKIEVSKDGKTFHFSGTAVGMQDDKNRRGCSVNEIRKYGFNYREFDGTIVDGNKISIGVDTYEGVWEPAGKITDKSLNGANLDGIRWSNGNKWTKVVPGPKGSLDRIRYYNEYQRTKVVPEGTLFDKPADVQENAAEKGKETISLENAAEETKEFKGEEPKKEQEFDKPAAVQENAADNTKEMLSEENEAEKAKEFKEEEKEKEQEQNEIAQELNIYIKIKISPDGNNEVEKIELRSEK